MTSLVSSLQTWAAHLQDTRLSEGLKVAIGKLVLVTHVNKDKKSGERKDILQAISEDKEVLQGFLFILENCEDSKVSRNVICLLRELLSVKSALRPTLLPILVDMNLSISVIKAFIHLYKTQELSDHSIGCVFWVLSALATKDTKFSIKIRLCDAVKPISTVLRFTLSKAKLIYPIIQVIKSLSRNVLTAGALGKDGVIPMIVCIIDDNFITDETGKRHFPKLKSSLECFLHLTKSKSNLLLMTKHGLTFGGVNVVAKILEIFKFKRSDTPKAKFMHCLLSILHNLVSIKLGRLHFLERKGLEIIKDFLSFLEISEERRWTKCIQRSSEIISHCCQKKVLMSEQETFSPLVFELQEGPLIFDSSTGGSRGSSPESDDNDSESEDSEPEDSDSDDNQEQDNQGSESPLPSSSSPRSFCRKGKDRLRSPQELQRDYGHLCKEFKLSHCHDSAGFLKESRSLYSLPRSSRIYHYKERSFLVERLYSFAKIALPDLLMAESPKGSSEPLLQKNRKSQRSRLLKSVKNMLQEEPHPGFPVVVYNLDDLLQSPQNKENQEEDEEEDLLTEEDLSITGTPYSESSSLVFESRFESGNLRRATQIGPAEYNLIITPDVNTNNHCQWFYFSVSNTKTGTPFVFNIVNYEKKNSQFNFGMQPVFFSSIAALHYGSPNWRRIGSDVAYAKNEFTVSSSKSSDESGKDAFMTASFTFEFPYDNDVVYLAYHYPYTYTRLRVMLDRLKWKQERNSSIFYREDVLCYSLCSNEVPLLTITSSNIRPEEKELIFLTSRVHPGETNASWIMEGTLVFLLSSHPEAVELRNNYIFKIVPMLNVEGVVHGSHRCGLTGEDLNRQWMSPSSQRHPTIFHTKGLIDYCHRLLQKPPFLFCDYHGHSRKKNVFLYGCSPYGPKGMLENMLEQHGGENEDAEEVYEDYLELEKALGKLAPYFDVKSCKYNVEKCRETTARVVVWREFGVNRSYTMESTFCGINKGTHKGVQISTIHLMDMGAAFSKSLNYIDYEYEEVEEDI